VEAEIALQIAFDAALSDGLIDLFIQQLQLFQLFFCDLFGCQTGDMGLDGEPRIVDFVNPLGAEFGHADAPVAQNIKRTLGRQSADCFAHGCYARTNLLLEAEDRDRLPWKHISKQDGVPDAFVNCLVFGQFGVVGGHAEGPVAVNLLNIDQYLQAGPAITTKFLPRIKILIK